MGGLRIDWKGVFPAMVTPFASDGAIDEAAFRALIDLLIEERSHGIIVAGSTGEWFSLDDKERTSLFAIAREQVAGRVPVLAGTSAIATAHTVALTGAAREAGCDGVMVLPPPYALPTTREVIAHFEAVARVGLPIMIYNNPNRTQINIDANLADKLADIDAVVCIKDSSKDLFQKSETLTRVRDRLVVFTGMEPYGMTMIHRGALGMVSMIANICGADVSAYYEDAAAGRWEAGLARQEMIDGAYGIVSRFGLGNYPTVKAAMRVLGRPGGDLRQPYLMAEPDTIDAIRDALAAIGLTRDGMGRRAAAD